MRFTLSALLLVLAVGVTPADDAKKTDGAKTDEKASPADQYKELQKQYGALTTAFRKDMQAAKTDEERKRIDDEFQPKHEKLARQFLDLAKANPKEGFALNALMTAMQDTTTDDEAIRFTVETFGDDKKIFQLIQSLAARPGSEKVLAKLADSKDKGVRGAVRYLQLTQSVERAEGDRKAKPEEQKKAFDKVRAKLADLTKEYGDVEVPQGRGTAKLSEAAKGVAYLLDHLVVGKTLEDVDCPTLEDGKTAKVSDYRGKVVVLDIWATWCGPCRAMIPHEVEMVKKLEGKPFALVSVSADDQKETLTKFLEKTDMPWTHWHAGAKGELLKTYQVKFFPTIYVLDAKGVIRHKNIRGKELEEAVEELLKEAGK